MKIFCIGRNYVAHAHELNNDVPGEPVFFMKPDTSLLRHNKPFHLPEWSHEIHHEIELVIRINQQARKVPANLADNYYEEIGLGIDFTARDLQNQLKSNGLPWEKAKAFDHAAVVGDEFISKKRFNSISNISFHLDINGKRIQSGNSGLMIFHFRDIISYVSNFITLKKGDLIYTGTPAGVGAVSAGDHLEGYLEDSKLLDFMIK
jgi:2-keto-4-pentenoate hydratase/2-oxohepta-3-ene-1,7-dioic acid hydratase in catechol pathway